MGEVNGVGEVNEVNEDEIDVEKALIYWDLL
jgi:hypothetical protein